MKIIIDGQEVSVSPRGPAGPDGNPIGTVISFMGTSAPEDYLVCDGTEYSISQYPALAQFFQRQFGGKNHFGGDGMDTFAVPDMRNLFLRGYHGETEEQLSGAVGEKQEATYFSNIGLDFVGQNKNLVGMCANDSGNWRNNADTTIGEGYSRWMPIPNTDTATKSFEQFSARPVNMAVLYCIKAVEGVGGGTPWNVYSTQETHIGTWIDGKPLYRKVYHAESELKANVSSFVPIDPDFHETLISAKGFAQPTWSSRYALPYTEMSGSKIVHSYSIGQSFETGDYTLWANCFSSYDTGLELYVICEYTKTTD